MIEHGAKLDLLDRMFWNALMFSVDSGHGDVARLLLDSGADPNLVNKNGQTAADLAAIRERDGGGLQDIIRSFTGWRGGRWRNRTITASGRSHTWRRLSPTPGCRTFTSISSTTRLTWRPSSCSGRRT